MVVWTGITVPINRKNAMRKKTVFKSGYAKVIPVIGTTDEYKAFVASMAISFSKLPRLGKALVTLAMKSSLHSRKDIDGIIKPVFDAIEKSGAIENDNQIKMIIYESFPVSQSEIEIISVELLPYEEIRNGDS